jgi:hypothetical protein
MTRRLRPGHGHAGSAHWVNEGWRSYPLDDEGERHGMTVYASTLSDIRSDMASPEVPVGTVWVVEQVDQARTGWQRVGELRKMAKGPVLRRAPE